MRHDISFTRGTGASLCCTIITESLWLRIVLCVVLIFLQKMIDDLKRRNYADFILSQLSSPVILLYSTSNSNRLLQTIGTKICCLKICSTYAAGQVLWRCGQKSFYQCDCAAVSQYLFYCWQSYSNRRVLSSQKETSCNDWTIAHLMLRVWAWSDLIIALLNRFMTCIQWHMADTLLSWGLGKISAAINS